MVMASKIRPDWYTSEDDTTWEKVKAAFRRDWEQTKHDMGGDAPNLNQQAGDTVAQASGSKPIPPGNVPTPHPGKSDVYDEADEPAYRYGYAASRHYADRTEWNLDTEKMLQNDWDDEQEWLRQREAVRRGWKYYRSHPDGSPLKTV